MKIKNLAQCKFLHIKDGKTYVLNAGEQKDLPKDIAKLWLRTGKVIKVDDGAKDAEIERLKAENKKLKAEANKAKEDASEDNNDAKEKAPVKKSKK